MYTRLFCLLLVGLFLLLSAISSPAELCSEGWDHEAREAEDQILTDILLQLQSTVQQQETLLKKQEISINNSKQETAQVNNSLNAALKSLQEEREMALAKAVAAGGIGIVAGWFLCWLAGVLTPP